MEDYASECVTLIDCGLTALVQRRLAKAKNTEPKGEAPPGSTVRSSVSTKYREQ